MPTPTSTQLLGPLVRDAAPAAGSRSAGVRRAWSRWNESPSQPYTVGVEEEILLLDASDYSLAPVSDSVLAGLSEEMSAQTSPETHAAVIELTSGIHRDVPAVIAEMASLRTRLAGELGAMKLRAASSGTYPLVSMHDQEVSGASRYRVVADSMRALARREPTLALHVHVGVPEAEDAVRVLNGLRCVVPLLLAVSANSPFCGGADTGFASARTVIFQAFPRTGTARRFVSYADYVSALDPLIVSGALPDPTFLWWDVRLQPRLGTVEVRVMDAQSSVADTAALVALVQSLARLELEGESIETGIGAELLEENRFLAARDGMDAWLVEPAKQRLAPARAILDTILAKCRRHADALGCYVELEQVRRLMAANGADRQRVWARRDGPTGLVRNLTRRFTAPGGSFSSAVENGPRRGGLSDD